MRLKSNRVLTEPLELCECGCGLRIDPRVDPTPLFKHYNCQTLWMISQSKPAHLQEAWRRRQRRWFEMVNQGAQWNSSVDWFPINASYVAGCALSLLSSYMSSRDWRKMPSLFDAEQIHRDYNNHLLHVGGSWRPPDWSVERYAEPRPAPPKWEPWT